MTNRTGPLTQKHCARKHRAVCTSLQGWRQHPQEAATNLLAVGGCQCPPVRSSVLKGVEGGGTVHPEGGHCTPVQTGEEGRFCRGH